MRGLVLEITESQYRTERAFVDADEMPELLRGVDALLEVKANPTGFKNFEVRYATKGDLLLIAFNDASGNVRYSVQAGRVTKASKFIDAGDMAKLRAIFAAAADRLKQP